MDRRVFLALAASSAAWWPRALLAAQGAAPRPIEDFAALPFMQGPLLSPDGTRVASKVAAHGEQFLAIAHLVGDVAPRIVGAYPDLRKPPSGERTPYPSAFVSGPSTA